jgi:uncharacterized protein (TIGR03067 family)
VPKGNILTIKGAQWGVKGQKALASFELDPSTNPKTIDLKSLQKDDGSKGEVSEGIYKIDGDTFVTCLYFGQGVKQRPLEFVTKAGSKLIIYGWKRAK